MTRFSFIFSFILLFSTNIFSQSISGFLFDEQNEPLIAGNVYIQGTNIGIATNKDGYFFLKLPIGTNKIIITYLGYQNDTILVSVQKGESLKRNINLKQSSIQLDAVTVYSTYHNSAERIILKAIEKKEEYLSKIKNYEYSAYSSTTFILKPDSTKEVIGGITEIQSKGFFQAPNNFQEVVLAKRQTANFSELYNVFSSGKILSVLDDVINIDELAVVSPLNKNALDYYKFEMIDTTDYNFKRVFNISVKPNSNSIPLFEGKISIIDDIFIVINVELYGKERIKSTLKSDVVLKQSFREFENYFWLPVQFNLFYSMDLGIPGVKKLYLKQQSQLTNYVLNNPNFEHKYNDRLLLQTNLSKEAEDSLWNESQIVALSKEERDAYHAIDSSMATKNFLIKFLVKLPEFYLKIKRSPATELWDFYRFNRTEGNYLGIGFNSLEMLGPSKVELLAGYGFGDKKTKYSISGSHNIIQDKLQIHASLHNTISFLDPYYEYRKYDITLQQLLFNKDYADYYYSQGWSAGLEWRVFSNLKSSFSFSQDKVTNAYNNNVWSLLNKSRNIRNSVPILEGYFNQINFSIDFDDRKYLDYGWGYIQNNAADFFRLNFDYTAAPQKMFNNNFPYEQYRLFLNIYTKFPPYLNINFSTLSGYLNNDSVIQRNFHLPGSYGSITNPHLFRTINQDAYLGNAYLCFFIENNFKNTIFNFLSLPFLKNSKFDLYLFGNFGWIKNKKWVNGNSASISQNPLAEGGFGLGNIFFFLRMDFTWRLTHREKSNFFFNISSNLTY